MYNFLPCIDDEDERLRCLFAPSCWIVPAFENDEREQVAKRMRQAILRPIYDALQGSSNSRRDEDRRYVVRLKSFLLHFLDGYLRHSDISTHALTRELSILYEMLLRHKISERAAAYHKTLERSVGSVFFSEIQLAMKSEFVVDVHQDGFHANRRRARVRNRFHKEKGPEWKAWLATRPMPARKRQRRAHRRGVKGRSLTPSSTKPRAEISCRGREGIAIDALQLANRERNTTPLAADPHGIEGHDGGKNKVLDVAAQLHGAGTPQLWERPLWFYSGSGILCRNSVQPRHKPAWWKVAENEWDLDIPCIPSIDVVKLQRLAFDVCPRSAPVFSYLLEKSAFHSLWNANKHSTEFKKTIGMERHVEKIVEAGIWKPIPRANARTYISAFTVPKPKKEMLRLIANAIPLNDQQIRLPDYELRLPDLPQLEHMVLRHSFFAELDGVSFFNQFQIPDWFSRHLAVHISGATYAWTTLPMGWKNSVDVAQAASETLQAQVGGSWLAFVDNLVRFGDTVEQVERDTESLLRVAQTVRASLEVTAPARQHGTLLGIKVNLGDKTTDITDDFKTKLQLLSNRLNDAIHTFREYWEVIGSVIWGLRVRHVPLILAPHTLRWLRAHTGHLIANNEWDHSTSLPTRARSELTRLISLLVEGAPYRIQENCDDVSPWVFSDASNTKWGLVWFEDQIRYASGEFPTGIQEQHIAIKELWAALQAVQKMSHRRIEKYTLFCDNQNVVSWLQKWHARPPLASEILRRIYDINHSFSTLWVPTDDNPADGPSRGRPVMTNSTDIFDIASKLRQAKATSFC